MIPDTAPVYPIACQRTEVHPDFCAQDVHGWFDLTYSSYLALPRSLMQAMPAAWQHAMVQLLERMHEEFPGERSSYRVLKIDVLNGRFVSDPLRNYRYPDHRAIEWAHCDCPVADRTQECHAHEHAWRVYPGGDLSRMTCDPHEHHRLEVTA